MRRWWSDVVQGRWLTVWRQLCKCLTHRWHSLSTRLPAATRKLPGRTSTAAMALPAVSANSVGDWSCVKLFPPLPLSHTTFHFRCCSAVLCLCVCAAYCRSVWRRVYPELRTALGALHAHTQTGWQGPVSLPQDIVQPLLDFLCHPMCKLQT